MSGDVRFSEQDTPFTAAVASSLLSAAFTWSWLYRREYLPIVTVLLLIAAIRYRFHIWALAGSTLTNLLLVDGTENPSVVYVAGVMILVGIAWEFGAALFDGSLVSRDVADRSTPRHNTVFAAIGIIANLIFYVLLARRYFDIDPGATIGENVVYVAMTIFIFWSEPLAEVSFVLGSDPEIVSINPALTALWESPALTTEIVLSAVLLFGYYLGRAWLLSPPFWGSAMAALRQIGFRIWELPTLLRQTWRAYRGGFYIGCLPTIILGIALITVPLWPTPETRGLALLVVITLSYFFIAQGIGEGAGRGLPG